MTATERSFFTRMQERLRYGLATQEALDRLARIGLIYCPYYLVKERAGEEPEFDAASDSITFAKLGPEQAPLVAGLPCRRLEVERICERMRTTTCYGVFDGADLAGYSWAAFDAVRAPMTLAVLFELDERGAYLFDMYVARAHRGQRLAPWLRYCVYREIMRDGRDELYSLTLANNQSSRRFKARLGAVEIEKRLAVGLKSVIVSDVRLRALTQDPLPSPKSMSFRGKLPES